MNDLEVIPSSKGEFSLTHEARERLKILALHATPGPWLVWDDGDIGTAYEVAVKNRHGEKLIESKWIANCSGADSSYIAAVDPGTLLALLAQLENLEKEVEQLKVDK